MDSCHGKETEFLSHNSDLHIKTEEKKENGAHDPSLTTQQSENTLFQVNWNICLHFGIISFRGFLFHYVYI